MFGLSVYEVLGLFFVGYVLITALVFFLSWLLQIISCGFHDLLSKLSSGFASGSSSDVLCCDCEHFSACCSGDVPGDSHVCDQFVPDARILGYSDDALSP